MVELNPGERARLPQGRGHDLAAVLHAQAEQRPEATAFIFTPDGTTVAGRLSFAALDQAARELGARLQQLQHTAGERVLLLLPAGVDFVVALFACFAAGVVAVPVAPPNRRQAARLDRIVRATQPAVVISTQALCSRFAESIHRSWPEVQWLEIDAPPGPAAPPLRPSASAPSDLAIIQYASGSTSTSKGVMLTHANVLANLALLQAAYDFSPASVAVSWLPPYHDFGLIGFILAPVFVGAQSVLLPPAAFYADPLCWLRAIGNFRASISGAPAFAYDECVRRLTPALLPDLHLHSWQLAVIGAEPVYPRTISLFANALATAGFSRSSFAPAYGLAEATLFVSGGRPRLSAGGELRQPVPAPDLAHYPRHTAQCVPSGTMIDPHSVVIVDPGSQRPLAAGEFGEIWVTGPSVALGYWQNPALSARTFGLRVADDARTFLRTGDLGAMRDGELWVVGRVFDQIIVQGSKYLPEILEAQLLTRFREICGCAAFADPQQDVAGIVVVAELAEDADTPPELTRLHEDCLQALSANCDLESISVAFVRQGTLPRTANGKLNRTACAQAYADAALPLLSSTDSLNVGPPATKTLAWPVRVRFMAASLAVRFSRILQLTPGAVRTDVPIPSLGITSLQGLALHREISRRWHVDLPLRLFLTDASLLDLARALLTVLPTPAAVQEAGAALPLPHERFSNRAELDKRYWMSALAPPLPELQWQVESPPAAVAADYGSSESQLLAAGLLEGLRELGRQHNTTLFVTLLTVYQVLLYRHLRQPADLMVGILVPGSAGDADEDHRHWHLLPIRTRPKAHKSFAAYLREVRSSVVAALAHRSLPFAELIQALTAAGAGNQDYPLQVLFTMVDADFDPVPDADPVNRQHPHDLALNFQARPDGLRYQFSYRCALFEQADATRMVQRLLTLAQDVVSSRGKMLGELALLDKRELTRLLRLWSTNELDFSVAPDLFAVLTQQTADTPKAAAVLRGDAVLSYADLQARTQRLADNLRAFGVGAEDKVAICADYSFELIIAIIGVLRAGAAVVVLDPTRSEPELVKILAHAEPVCVLAQSQFQLALSTPAVPALHIDAELSHWRETATRSTLAPILTESLASLSYRLDAADQLLGTCVSHGALRNSVFGLQAHYRLTAKDSMLLLIDYADCHLLVKLLWPLLVGASLVLPATPRRPNPEQVAALSDSFAVSTVCLDVAGLEEYLPVLGTDRCRNLRRVFCHDGVLSAALCSRWQALAAGELHNLYGMGAITLDVLLFDPVTPAVEALSGRPGPNNAVYLLGPQLEPVPTGVVGEICIAGAQLARGYFRRPDLTAVEFIPHPFVPGARLYRSGALGRFTADGRIVYCGRKFSARPDKTAVLPAAPGSRIRDLQALHAPTPPLLPPNVAFIASGPLGRVNIALSVDESSALAELAEREAASLELVVLLAWGLLLRRYTGQAEVEVAVAGLDDPTAPRASAAASSLGCEAAKSLRIPLRADRLWLEELTELTDLVRCWSAQKEALQYEPEQRALAPSNHYVLVFQSANPELNRDDDALLQLARNKDSTILHISTTPWIDLTLYFGAGRFAQRHLQVALQQMRVLLLHMLQQPRSVIGNLTLGTASAELPKAAGPGLDYLASIEQQVQRRPDAAAIRHAGESLTYEVLHRRSLHLAARLAARGIGAGTTVGVLDGRSVDLAVMILAVMRCGGILLLLDPKATPETWQQLLQQANAVWVLSNAQWSLRLGRVTDARIRPLYLPEVETEAMERDSVPMPVQAPHTVVEARGATTPVALLEYHAFSSALHSWVQCLDLHETDTLGSLLETHAPAFTEQLLAGLAVGATIDLLPTEINQAVQDYRHILRARHIAVVVGVSSQTASMLAGAAAELPELRRVLVEARRFEADFSSNDGEVDLVYCLTCYGYAGPVAIRLQSRESSCQPGFALAPGVQICIVDGLRDPMPTGTPGFIAVTGPGLATAYTGGVATTAAQLLPHPAGALGARMLLTDWRGWYQPESGLHLLDTAERPGSSNAAEQARTAGPWAVPLTSAKVVQA